MSPKASQSGFGLSEARGSVLEADRQSKLPHVGTFPNLGPHFEKPYNQDHSFIRVHFGTLCLWKPPYQGILDRDPEVVPK